MFETIEHMKLVIDSDDLDVDASCVVSESGEGGREGGRGKEMIWTEEEEGIIVCVG